MQELCPSASPEPVAIAAPSGGARVRRAEHNPFVPQAKTVRLATPGRMGVLDFVRGLLLVLITVNHFPGPHTAFTYERLGFFTWAEGFVFLAGLTGGLFWGRGLARSGPVEFRNRVWGRAWEIYVWHMATLAVVVLLGIVIRAATAGSAHQPYGEWFSHNLAPFSERPAISWTLAGALVLLPSLLDVLPMYCLFLLAAPFAFIACHAGRWRTVLAISAAVWVASHMGLGAALTGWMPSEWRAGFHVFDPFAWQLLFVVGLIVGHLAARRELPAWVLSPWTTVMAALIVLGCMYLRLPWEAMGMHAAWAPPFEWVDRRLLPPGRILSFLAFVLVFAAIYRARPQWFTWEPLECLGRNSLPAFSAHIVYLYCFTYWVGLGFQTEPHATKVSAWTSVGLMALGVICLFAVARAYERYMAAGKASASPARAGEVARSAESRQRYTTAVN
ncbi:hypothetical protein DB346_02050 [Verrucomicrobia bacterium LW23]|nr:hypothetical protein DB346_02050 [Verrucomicrobia bacterium LW23]